MRPVRIKTEKANQIVVQIIFFFKENLATVL